MKTAASLLMCLAFGPAVVGCNRGDDYRGISQVQVEMRQIAQAVVVWVHDHHRLPGSRTADVVEAIRSSEGRGWYEHDPARIKDGQLLDPWGKPYLIVVSDDGVCVASSGGRDSFDPDHTMTVLFSFRNFDASHSGET